MLPLRITVQPVASIACWARTGAEELRLQDKEEPWTSLRKREG
jgi:hypothetical protein